MMTLIIIELVFLWVAVFSATYQIVFDNKFEKRM
jgi:hypothetical protein